MHNATTATHEVEIEELGQPDSLFGICQTVGDSLGFNPVFLRVGLIGILFFSPALMVGAYLGLGLVVGGSHLLFPKPGQSEVAGGGTDFRPRAGRARARAPRRLSICLSRKLTPA